MKLANQERETVTSFNEDKELPNCIVFAELDGLKLQADHLDQALALFKREHHAAPAVLGIANHKGNDAIIAEAKGRGFTVIHELGGILAFEVWMFQEPPLDRKIPTEGLFLATTKNGPIPSCQKSDEYLETLEGDGSLEIALSKTLRGRPKLDVPVAEIKRLGEQRLGSKAIAGQLKAEGYSVSFRTVARVLSGERQ